MYSCQRLFAHMVAGVTWKLMIASTPWAARQGHTTVIDAAGAIYVIGGCCGTALHDYKDVWVSTDGGADGTRADYSGGATKVLEGYSRGHLRRYSRGVGVHMGLFYDAQLVLAGYCWCSRDLPVSVSVHPCTDRRTHTRTPLEARWPHF
jgi:hypothetical protein